MRKKFFTHLFFLCLILGLAFTTNAQDLKTSAGTSNIVVVNEPNALLYDQTGNPGTNGSPSQYFPDFLGAGESADDFTVPATEVWTIDTVFIVGTFSSTGLYVDLDVNIYNDDGPGGMPGTVFYSDLGLVDGVGPVFTVALSVPAVVPEGHYWFNFMVNMPVTEGQFFWSNSNVPKIDSFKVFRDSTDLFGTGAFLTWATTEGSAIGGGVEPDLQYAFYGTLGVIPVELTSFAASVSDGNVTLNWGTATETNNQGFDVERNSGNGFEKIGFVAGFGTSTEVHSYSYVDASVEVGTYTYRLKQVDYDGTFEYSSVVEVDVTAPNVFALQQNYPNPFNPNTMIKFSLAADSKVSLSVFDVLGQKVANLISGNLTAGSHEIDFNASNVNSGVYFYRIDATAVVTSVKKMILTK
jgi:hypothetical protein